MWLIEWHPTLNATNHRVAPAGELLHEPSRLFVFVGFSDDRRPALVVRFGVVAFVLVIIIIVIVEARGGIVLPMMMTSLHSTAEKFSGMRWVMVGSLLDVATFMRAGPEPQPLVTGFGPLVSIVRGKSNPVSPRFGRRPPTTVRAPSSAAAMRAAASS